MKKLLMAAILIGCTKFVPTLSEGSCYQSSNKNIGFFTVIEKRGKDLYLIKIMSIHEVKLVKIVSYQTISPVPYNRCLN